MKEIRVQFVESDVEHVIAGQTPCKQGEHHIEIITNGGQKLVFIDGKRLHRVLDIDVPLTAGEISPAITIKLHPDKITVRNVDGPQFKSIMKGERIIPSVENAALMGWSLKDLAEAVVAPLEAGLGGATLKPSKRELLEQILAEQRKTNELLSGWAAEARA